MIKALTSQRWIIFSLLLLCLSICFFIRSYLLLDPDLGWHIQLGHHIVTYGFPGQDMFSYTMPQHPVVAYEWGSEVLISLLYPSIHTIGLALIFTVFIIFSLAIQKLRVPRIPVRLLLYSFSFLGIELLYFSTISIQVISILFFSILSVLLYTDYYSKYTYVLPILFLVWTNLHPGVVMGIILYALYISGLLFEKKLQKNDLLISGLSLTAVFMQPYGIRYFQEILNNLTSPQTMGNIIEWHPAWEFYYSIGLWVMVFVSTIHIIRSWRNYSPAYIISFVIFLYLGISHFRNMPFWMLLAFPVFTDSLRYIYRSSLYFLTITVILLASIVIEIPRDIHEAQYFSEQQYYPQKAVLYLQNHLPAKNLFAPFSWGGYLAWKLPEKKVFINGNMPFWTSNNGRYSVFTEYLDIINEKIPLSAAVTKYRINTILLPNNKQSYTLVTECIHIGMRKIYADETSIIYQK